MRTDCFNRAPDTLDLVHAQTVHDDDISLRQRGHQHFASIGTERGRADNRTDPGQAADFVQSTGVDALAIAIGTSHGAYKFSRQPTGDILAIDRIREINRRIPNTHLVMHGSSSVPQEWLAIIRQYGGDIKETYGVPVEEIQAGIRHGVRKINIDTDIRLAMTGAMRQAMAETPSEFDPRKFLSAATRAAKGMCKTRFDAFGSAGRASRIRPVALESMANNYARRSGT